MFSSQLNCSKLALLGNEAAWHFIECIKGNVQQGRVCWLTFKCLFLLLFNDLHQIVRFWKFQSLARLAIVRMEKGAALHCQQASCCSQNIYEPQLRLGLVLKLQDTDWKILMPSYASIVISTRLFVVHSKCREKRTSGSLSDWWLPKPREYTDVLIDLAPFKLPFAVSCNCRKDRNSAMPVKPC